MKYFIIALFIMLCSSCLLSSYIINEYDIEITGIDQAHLIVNNTDYGFIQLPYVQHIIHDNQGYNAIKSIQVWSTEIVELNLYKDNILIFNKIDTYIEY